MLRVGHIKGECNLREVRLAYGRNWVWKGAEGKMKDTAWGGVEVLGRVTAGHFAQRFVEILTGQEDAPGLLLGPEVSFARWEAKIGEWVYFVELAWAEGQAAFVPVLAPRAELYFQSLRRG